MNESPLEAAIKKRRRFAPIWLLPLLALVIVVWLVWRTLNNAGVEVSVRFESGRGLAVGQTEVVHNGIAIGKVTHVAPSKDLLAVDVSLEIQKEFARFLTESATFWMVKPQVSFAGISGLDTLISGNYIAFSPGTDGVKKTQYVALASPPPNSEEKNGLSLVLRAHELSSVDIGSPVYYRRLQVGEVSGYSLAETGEYVNVHIYIKQAFAHLIHENTRFWNASGVNVSGSLADLKVRTESLISLVQGGIAFYTPSWEKQTESASDGQEFLLFKDYDEAEAGIPINIQFPLDTALGGSHLPIRFHGFEVGRVRDVEVNDSLTHLVASATVRPEVQKALVEGVRFWLVEPQVSLKGVSGLDTLLGGRYIAMDFNKKDLEKGKPTREFNGLARKPAAPETAPGLHIQLMADALSGVSVGSPVLYRSVPVGSVQDYELKESGVVVRALIEKKYEHLINESTRFWNISGVALEGSLSGFQVKMSTLTSLISGGIAFRTQSAKAKRVNDGASFTLFEDEADSLENKTRIDVWFESADGLQVGTRVKFKGMIVGVVDKLLLERRDGGVIAKVSIEQELSWLANDRASFWLVKPQLGLTSTAHLETLVTGQYINIQLHDGQGKPKHRFTGSLKQPDDQPLSGGLRLELVSDRLGSIRRGNPVYYREIPVGQVTGYKLSNLANQVIIYINIEDRYRRLVSPTTRFWNASGVDINVGLFSGATIKTESLESVLAGGIAFATPDAVKDSVSRNHRFWLLKSPKDEWLEWSPKIKLE